MKSLTIRDNIHSRWSACFCAALLLLDAARLSAATHTVTIAGFAFQPPSLTISVGDTVRWVNQDAVGHTTTCDLTGGPVCGFSPLLGQGGTFQFTYTQPGTFPYHCSPHPFMRGTVTVQAPNLPPLVSITAPTNGAVFAPPAIIAIETSATDSDGTVRAVEFFANTLSLAVVTNAPFSYQIPAAAVPAGAYALTAQATDNAGARSTSAPVNVLIRPANIPPAGAITSPSGGAVFTPPLDLEITATATDTDGAVARVEFFASGIRSA